MKKKKWQRKFVYRSLPTTVLTNNPFPVNLRRFILSHFNGNTAASAEITCGRCFSNLPGQHAFKFDLCYQCRLWNHAATHQSVTGFGQHVNVKQVYVLCLEKGDCLKLPVCEVNKNGKSQSTLERQYCYVPSTYIVFHLRRLFIN